MPLYVNVDRPPRRPPAQSLLNTAARLGLLADGTVAVDTGDWSSPAPRTPDQAGPESPVQSTIAPNGAVPEPGTPGEREWWRRMGGVSYEAPPCTGGGLYDPCDPDPVSATVHPSAVEVAGFPVKVGTYCSTLDGWTFDAQRAQTAELLWIRQHYLAGREFWRGEQAVANSWPNAYLTDSTTATIAGEDVTPCGGLAVLEEVLAGTLTDADGDLSDANCSGSLGMIHASPALVTAWLKDHLVFNQGGVLYTHLGNVVVTGPGYDGTGPGYSGPEETADGESWAYATGLVQVRLGPAKAPRELESIDKDINRAYAWAERMAQVSWDGCCHAAVQVDLGDCSTVTGSGGGA